jgi:D-lactate dehydrogenase (cytochrome)
VTLRLYGIPEAILAAVCPFPSIEAAVDTVVATIQAGVPVARIELLDEVSMAAIVAFAKLEGYAAAPHLFFEFHGTPRGVEEQVAQVKEFADEHGGSDFRWAASPEERSKLWQARHDAHYAAMASRPGTRVWATDVCVPISRLAQCVSEARRDMAQTGLQGGIVGHVGDGNFHIGILVDPARSEEIAAAGVFNERLVQRAIAMDGTCTGEHGVGSGKIDFLLAEHGEGVTVMRALKLALDPNNIMNPGKVVRL